MDDSKFILITRPVEESRVFARKLKQEGFNPKIEPMLEIAWVDFDIPDMDMYQGLVFTSVNAVRGMAAQMKARHIRRVEVPCYCVGDRTAKEARARGFVQAISAKGTADDLVELVAKRAKDKALPLLYVRGVHTARPVDKMLKNLGFRIDSIVVYEAKPVKTLSPGCITAIRNKQITGITFFSKRTLETFLREVKKNGLLKEFFGIKLLALSESMLECVRSYRQVKTYAAQTPDAAGMMRLIQKLYKK